MRVEHTKERISSQTLEGRYHVKQLNLQTNTLPFKDPEGNLELPENFKIGQAIEDGNCFFDSFRQGLKQQLGISVTVTQLRYYCRDFARNNPPKWFINAIANSHDNSGRVRSETLDSYTSNILDSNRWGEPEVEGRILCEKYLVKLHVVEKSSYLLYLKQQVSNNAREFDENIRLIISNSDSDETLALQLEKEHSEEATSLLVDATAFDGLRYIHQLISSSGLLPSDNINYDDQHTIHIINKGNEHFEPILGTQETRYDKRKQSHSSSVIDDIVCEVTQQLQNCQIKRKRCSNSFDSHPSLPKVSRSVVEDMLRTFVTCFVAFFKARIENHCDEAMGKKEKTSSILSSLSAMGLLVGGMRSLSLPLCGYVIDYCTKEFAKSTHSQKSARVAARSFNRLIGSSNSTIMLVKAAVEIFRSYEEQYVKRGDEKLGMFGIALSANTAVTRAIHYIQLQDLQDKEEDPEELPTLIIKGVILGNDNFRAKKASIRRKMEKYINIQAKYLDIFYNEDIYKKTGLVRITNNVNHYYMKDGSDTRKYGYRIMFEWEEDMLNKWTKEENVPQEYYEYSLKSEEVESKVDQIHSEIKKREPASKGDIMELSSVISKGFEQLQKVFTPDKNNNQIFLELINKLLLVAIKNDIHFTEEEQSNEISMLWSLRKGIATSHGSLFRDFVHFRDILCCSIPLNQVEIILYCIKEGILNDCCKETFLYEALEHGVVEIIDPLIQMVDLCFGDECVISIISCHDSIGVIKRLLHSRGVEGLNIRDNHGNSLLHIAARNGSVRVVEYIGKTIPGIDFNIRNNDGKTPKDLAESVHIDAKCLIASEEISRLNKVIDLCNAFSANHDQVINYPALHNTPNTHLSNVRSDAVTQERSCAEKANFWRAW